MPNRSRASSNLRRGASHNAKANMPSTGGLTDVESRPGETMPGMPHMLGDVFQALRDEIRRVGGGLGPRAMLPHVIEAGPGQPGALVRIAQELSEGVCHRLGVFWRDHIRLAGQQGATGSREQVRDYYRQTGGHVIPELG